MIRLFVQVDEQGLRARRAGPEEAFITPCEWEELQFEYTDKSMGMMTWITLMPDLPSAEAQSLLSLQGARYPLSTRHEELKGIAPELVFKDDANEWIFFGGSFNPWHVGHQACLDLLPEGKTCFILPDKNPHKEPREINPVAHTLSISVKARFRPKHYLVPTFLLELGQNPTVNWIERLVTLFPEKKLSLLLGHDGLASITHWTRAQDLLKALDRIYVVSRGESEDESKLAIKMANQISPELEIIALGRHQFEDFSSTKLRLK